MSTTDMPFEGSRLTVKEILDYPNPILDLQQKGRASDTSANPMWPLVTLEDVEDFKNAVFGVYGMGICASELVAELSRLYPLLLVLCI